MHDHRLGDLTAAGFAARHAFTEEWLTRVEGQHETLSSAQTQLSYSLMMRAVDDQFGIVKASIGATS